VSVVAEAPARLSPYAGQRKGSRRSFLHEILKDDAGGDHYDDSDNASGKK
jgi:hypothetical protein